ncbi:unnamed protein product, partial [Brenthis ino]
MEINISEDSGNKLLTDGRGAVEACISTERQFLSDFVAGAESTAGGRLARWLAPGPRVEPSRCELKPPLIPARPAARLSLPIIVRDQYGDIVCSPAIKIEVVVQRIEDSILRAGNSMASERRGSLSDVPYQPTVRDTMWFHAITMMKPYQNYSFEELRFASGAWGGAGALLEGLGGGGRIPAERIIVDAQRDGSYTAIWVPRTPGTYVFRCTLDDYPTAQDLKIDVAESGSEELAERWLGSVATYRLRRFAAEDSAGLRVRASPSLQAEELGRIPPGAYIAVVEELANKDGTWVRLSQESAQTYAESSAGVAWCLQYHGHLDRSLLLPVDDEDSQEEYAANWNAFNEAQMELPQWPEDDADAASNDLSSEDRRFPFSIQCDLASESDSSTSPYMFGEPSKRGRLQRNESTSMPTPRRMPRRNNGNSEEWWSPVKHRSSDNLREVDSLQETEILGTQETLPTRVAQTGTQTSPESTIDDIANAQFEVPKGDNRSPKRLSRERFMRSSRGRLSVSPPPLPARSSLPRKYALSPAQAECLRAVFAALLWHEGIVHDAIACAAFLKFHPQLPKAGARVVTRPPHDAPPPRPQRHSVEVSNAGQYLHIHQSTLETLTRSGTDASTSRAHKTDIDMPIREEDAGTSSAPDAGPSSSVVNVLPPALRALVALWDALNDADQLNSATDKNRKEIVEKNENDDSKLSIVRKKKENRAPLVVRCELCGGRNVPPPLAAHMRNMHRGCQALTNRGYDRAGQYKQADSLSTDNPLSECGQLAQDLIGVKIRATLVAYQLWYIFCEKCRERALKATAEQRKGEGESESSSDRATPDLDHHAMRDNAVFLLDLAPLINSESSSSSGYRDLGGRSPPTPPGSVWQPAPPFQCLPALGAAPKSTAPMSDTARYHSLGRPLPATIEETPSTSGAGGAQLSRVPRSVSMGQAGGRDLAHAARPPMINIETDTQDTLSGVGSSLLAQPSAALQKLVGGGEWASEGCAVSAFEPPQVDPEALMRSPVLAFILAKRELPACRQKMDAAVRINTIRQYAFEALNWLLRSTTQPTSVHDVMWWFCNAIDKFARIVPPPLSFEDNKENVGSDWSRYAVPTASAAAICPGGRAARGSRAAFHAFLGSVSALAPSLPPASAAALQAVRCWALHYSQHDRAFLHRSQVFSVISKILSHAEDGAYEEGMVGALHESYQSYISKQPNFIYTCPDVTGWCEVTVSSRTGMAGALTDGSTETFWESGDEDRNRAKWIQLSYARPSHQDKPHIICVHVDNTRDTMNKTLLMSFLYSGGTSEMSHMQDIEVDPKAATWVCYTLPRSSSSSVRVRCELRGPEPAVRVRQIRVLGAPTRTPNPHPHHPLHSLAERDTLRVFRLLTQQVFGKLLEWEHSSSESGEGAAAEEAAGDDSDLREHVVGILFAGHKLTSLQRQVMSHIVCAIGCEAARVRDDWETALLCAETLERDEDELPRVLTHHQQDNYCFEMLSLLLALSGSAVGRAHLAQRTELLADLLALLHTGSERVQRQVISLVRRVIAEVPPQKILAALNYAGDVTTSVTLLDHLVCYVGKALTVQVKVKGGGAASPGTVTLGSSVTPAPPAAWFMRGDTTKKHAHLVAKLLTDMAEDKVSEAWGMETRTALVQYVRAVAQVEESERRPPRCISSPIVWLALAALCVCDHHHMDLMNGSNEGRESRARDSVAEARPHCTNHDDGSTVAVIECRSCGPLCAECDRFLHLNRAARNHQRQICKEEESAIRIDIHEGCGRAKLHWLLLLVDRRTLKALMEFRGLEGAGNMPSETDGAVGLAGTCRFCGARGNSGLLAIGNVCADQQCQEHGREACNRVLGCGHSCGGVRGERTCLPCLFGCAGGESLRQDADDMCMICFTDPLQAAPAIQLSCGHVFHLHCCKKVLANKWVGPRITFSFSQCPICKEDMSHWTLEELLTPIRRLREEVSRKALMRLEYEGVAAGGSQGRAQEDPAAYAMERYAYYVCHKCGKAYFGGLARCEAESSGWWEPTELVCGACSDVAGARTCPKHGADFLEYKCRYCCSVAVFFCFGTSHFCNACHDDFQRVTNIPRHLLPQCPAGPKGEQLPGSSDECPLHVQHPPTGEEFALGCVIDVPYYYFCNQNWLNFRQIGPQLCTLAVAVSLNNTWRAPREAFRYGGLTSALLTTVAYVGVALPVVLLQLSVGQLSQQDAVGIWRAVPFFKGIGYLRLLISYIGAVYSMVYVGMSLTYILFTLSDAVPFWECFDLSEMPEGDVELSYDALACLNGKNSYTKEEKWRRFALHSPLRSTILIVVANIVTSWLGILFWFAIGGDGDKSTSGIAVLVQIYKVAAENNLSTAWPLLTFAMLTLSGVITMLTFLYPLYDRFRRVGGYKWRHVSMGSSIMGIVGALALLAIGHPAFTLLEDIVIPLLLSVATTLEVSVFIFIYGWKVLVKDIEFLIETKLVTYWVLGWCATPGIIIPFTLWWSISFFLDEISWTKVPWECSGIVATLCTILLTTTIFAAVSVARQVQYDFIGKLKSSFKPSRHWGPRDPITHHYWLSRREEVDRHPTGTIYRRRQLGQFSGTSSVADISLHVKSSPSTQIKRRSNSDDWLIIYRKKNIAELYQVNIENRKRSKSLDWDVMPKVKLHVKCDIKQINDIYKASSGNSIYSIEDTNYNIPSNVKKDLV